MTKAARGRPRLEIARDQETVKTSVDVTREALELLNAYANKYGKRGPRVTILSALIETFSRLPSPIKDLMARRLEDDMKEICATQLRHWADAVENGRALPSVIQENGKQKTL